MLIDAEPFKVQGPPGTELRLHRSGYVHWRPEGQLVHPSGDHRKVYGDDSGHLYGAAKGNLAVPLGEVQITHGEPGALDVDRQVDFGTAGQVLDVAVSTVLRAAGDGSGPFAADFFGHGG